MAFRLGEEVIIRKASAGQGNYYHGGTVKQVPLGSRGRIVEMDAPESIRLFLEANPKAEVNPRKRNFWDKVIEYLGIKEKFLEKSSYWLVHPAEISPRSDPSPKPQISTSNLQLLLSNNTIEAVNDADKSAFQPGFNVREEFAVWVRKQFPQLEDYVKRKEKYKELEERRDEVMSGARKAYDHAMQTAGGCARTGFQVSFARLIGDKNTLTGLEGSALDAPDRSVKYFTMKEEDTEGSESELFPSNLNKFVITIERSSLSLGSKDKHYGTRRK
ncbi:MAG: hypothetical protein Q8Q31_00445 [Nanoarchaeota archaeon]|nr:hypothetical protein [Nanoarchaeota archaeon]